MIDCPPAINYDLAGFVNDVLMNVFTGIIIILALIPLYLSSNYSKEALLRNKK